MRKFIPIMFVAATMLVGCRSTPPSNKTTTASTKSMVNPSANTNAVASTNAVAATPAPPAGPNTPADTLSENVQLGDFGAACLVGLSIVALGRPWPPLL